MPVVQFQPFTSLVQPEFWHELTRRKVDELRLSQDALPIHASYALARTARDRESGADIALPANFALGGDAFGDAPQRDFKHGVVARGSFRNVNTMEEFKSLDKAAVFAAAVDEMWTQALEQDEPSALTRFFVICFADLKKYKYVYWFGFPTFTAKPAWEIDAGGWTNASEVVDLDALWKALNDKSFGEPYFIAKSTGEVASLKEYDAFFAGVPENERIIAFLDPCASDNPGWPLRNLLAYLRHRHPTQSTFRILSFRDSSPPPPTSPSSGWKSRIGTLSVAASWTPNRKSTTGWEKSASGKLAPRLADLAPSMDPHRLAAQAVDLNLKLMRWRLLPQLDLERIANTRCLLLGAGTLGCYVARGLLAWGVRNITLLDSGRVSFSNPVRQPLFEFEDCVGADGGKHKAEAAAEALKRIFPGVNARGVSMSIPMPGHPVAPGGAEEERVRADVRALEALFDEHDAVFLLMDSRESRWLPTVLGVAKRKIVMNAALGFDTYLVMRHGAPGGPEGRRRLGCYYCNDIVAPGDSLSDRTLDQMCTVTRPGLAAIASASAVELLASLLQHPDGIHAPAPPPKTTSDDAPEGTEGVLGLVPHQLRGYLAQFRTLPVVGDAFARCTACSEKVVKAYETDGWDMLKRAFNERDFLEKLTGLDELYAEGDAALEAVDWDEEGEGGEDVDDF